MDPSGKELVQQHLALAGASYPEDRTFPSLGDLEMETGILEEPDLTFASSFNTTADSTLQAPGVLAPAGVGPHEVKGCGWCLYLNVMGQRTLYCC